MMEVIFAELACTSLLLLVLLCTVAKLDHGQPQGKLRGLRNISAVVDGKFSVHHATLHKAWILTTCNINIIFYLVPCPKVGR